MNEAYQTIRNNFIQNEELKRLEELKNKYANFQQPDYSTMSTHDELQTRFDLNELNDLQQKYANQQQTPTPWAQSANMFVQPAKQSANSFWQNVYNKTNQMADTFADDVSGATIAFTQGILGNNFDELTGSAGAAIITGLSQENNQNLATYNNAYKNIRDNIRNQHNNFKEKYPNINEALEIGGTVLNKIKNPYISAVSYGIGSADNMEQVPEEIIYNALGNKYSRKIPTSYFSQPEGRFVQEYSSRKIPELIKDYSNNKQ